MIIYKAKKWVVRSKDRDILHGHDFIYVKIINISNSELKVVTFNPKDATKFDTKEEAESWANYHQEVVDVNDD